MSLSNFGAVCVSLGRSADSNFVDTVSRINCLVSSGTPGSGHEHGTTSNSNGNDEHGITNELDNSSSSKSSNSNNNDLHSVSAAVPGTSRVLSLALALAWVMVVLGVLVSMVLMVLEGRTGDAVLVDGGRAIVTDSRH